jgi:hypothetical protein
MKTTGLLLLAFLTSTRLLADTPSSEDRTSPVRPEDREAAYTVAIEKRTEDILNHLSLSDSAKTPKVRDLILSQYRSLRARDEAIDAKLKALGKDAAETEKERVKLYENLSKPIHDQFLASLSKELTPEQVEVVKDRMTYGKVKFTYDAFCQIVPGLTDKDKEKILELLKQAREEAIDGGSAKQKSDIFQKYKDKINEYLNAQGHDTAKAFQDWDAKQAAAKKQKDQ